MNVHCRLDSVRQIIIINIKDINNNIIYCNVTKSYLRVYLIRKIFNSLTNNNNKIEIFYSQNSGSSIFLNYFAAEKTIVVHTQYISSNNRSLVGVPSGYSLGNRMKYVLVNSQNYPQTSC